MAEETLAYDRLIEDALRGVVREALRRVAVTGLPAGHYFYITFRTRYPGVELADSLRAEYSDEMTIVLQHQFWELAVDDDGFEVGLSFKAVPHRLRVPFAALTRFADPEVKFALQFQPREPEAAPAPPPAEAPAEPPAGDDKVVSLDRFKRK
jgi:hypothetical protein